MPAMRPPAIFSRRLRRCFLDRAPLPFALAEPGRPLPDERAAPELREVPAAPGAPLRDAVVRARPPAGGRPDRSRPPPPPVGRERDGVGRRTDPARGAPGEVSSWDGTREPLSDFSVRRRGQAPVAALSKAWRLQVWERGRTRFAATRVRLLCSPGRNGPPDHSVATRRRLRRGCCPGAGSAPRTYEASRWFQPHLRHTSTSYTVNCSCIASIRASSASVFACPDV